MLSALGVLFLSFDAVIKVPRLEIVAQSASRIAWLDVCGGHIIDERVNIPR